MPGASVTRAPDPVAVAPWTSAGVASSVPGVAAKEAVLLPGAADVPASRVIGPAHRPPRWVNSA